MNKITLLTATAFVAICALPANAQEPLTSGPVLAPAAVATAPSAQPKPNIFVWMLDDVGYAQLGAFGGLIETPNIDRVAAMGLRFNNYHTTPICSASRASFLTGRNPHTVHIGSHAFTPRPFPGYDGLIPRNAGTIAENLRQSGYTTHAFGKWDHLPAQTITPEGPFTYWPKGQGFDQFYGFLAADVDNWQPSLFRDTKPIPAPRSKNYHLDNDLADQAITMVAAQAAGKEHKPFFAYWATGTAHAPHHAPKRWIEHYKGRFDGGWDAMRTKVLERQIAMGIVPAGTELAPLPPGVSDWDSLSAEQKRMYARQMEVFAASLSHADEQFGRVVNYLKAKGQLDNTIIVITSDNGASAEGTPEGSYNEHLMANGHSANIAENLSYLNEWGGPKTYPHYSTGWAVAGNTPLRYYKQTTFEGGTRVSLLISWLKGIVPDAAVRRQYAHVSDLTPTLMQLAGVPLAPQVNGEAQMPLDGISFTDSVRDAAAPSRKQVQYTEMWGHKGLWADNWTINSLRLEKVWELGSLRPRPFDEKWQLFNLSEDLAQTKDLAAIHPEKVAELEKLFDAETRKYNVLPIGDIADTIDYRLKQMQDASAARQGKWFYNGPISHVSDGAGPPIRSGSFQMSADVGLTQGRETGPIFALGGEFGGLSLHLDKGVPVYTLRSVTGTSVSVRADRALRKGSQKLELIVEAPPPRSPEASNINVEIRSGGNVLVRETVRFVMPRTMFSLSDNFDIGIDTGSAVASTYSRDKAFPGTVANVLFDFSNGLPPQ